MINMKRNYERYRLLKEMINEFLEHQANPVIKKRGYQWYIEVKYQGNQKPLKDLQYKIDKAQFLFGREKSVVFVGQVFQPDVFFAGNISFCPGV